jgi:hypothetical protein
MAQMLSNASATGASLQWEGGHGVFTAAGTFGGATVSLQYIAPDNSTWVAMGPDTTLTAAGGGGFFYPPGLIRALVSGGTPSGLYAQAEKVR